MNKVSQMGNLARNPEVKQVGDSTVTECCIVTNRQVPSKGGGYEDKATFVEFAMWGKRGEAFARFHQKGSRACIHGRLETQSWVDRASGANRSKMIMVADEWEFVEGKKESSNNTEPTPF